MNIKEQRETALKAARAIVDAALAEGRELTDPQQAEVKSHMDEVAKFDSQLKGQALVNSVRNLGTVEDAADEPSSGTKAAGSLGEHFAKSVGEEGFSRLKTIGGYTVSAPEFTGPAKAATDVQVTTGGSLVPLLTEYDRNIVIGYRIRPVVADLLGSGTLAGNAITYFLEGAWEGDPGMVAEGAQKPQFHQGDPTTVTDALRKIAGWWDTSDEMVEDLPFLVSEINNRGLYRLAMVEEQQLLNGSGTGQNLRGILNRSGIQTEAATAADDNADALFRAMTKISLLTGFAADGVVINPVDYQALRLRRDGNSQYYGGGYFLPPYGEAGQTMALNQPLWGLRTIVTPAVPVGTAVVGSFQQAATVYRKGGVRVESTNSDLGKFTSNIITTRIEERVGLAVRYPAAIVKVTLA